MIDTLIGSHMNQLTQNFCGGVKNNFGIESVPDCFFPGVGAYTGSDKALRRKIGLACVRLHFNLATGDMACGWLLSIAISWAKNMN